MGALLSIVPPIETAAYQAIETTLSTYAYFAQSFTVPTDTIWTIDSISLPLARTVKTPSVPTIRTNFLIGDSLTDMDQPFGWLDYASFVTGDIPEYVPAAPNYTWMTANWFSGGSVVLTAGTYYIMSKRPAYLADTVLWFWDNDLYDGGIMWNTNQVIWPAWGYQTGANLGMIFNGTEEIIIYPPVDIVTYKRLTAAAKDTFWYEDI